MVLNFAVLQWFFVRLKNEDGKIGIMSAAPLSGFFGMELILPKDFRFVTWVIAYFSIAGVIINVFKNPFCFVIWGVTNTFWMVYNFRKKEYAQAFIFLIYLIVAIFGFLKWSGVL